MVPRIDTHLMADIITTLINEIGPGHMASTAYDTAWAARLDEIAPSISARALTWLTKNQLPDGTWGAPAPMYYHDRVVCTLAAMIALERRGHREADKEQILKGKLALERIVSGATGGLSSDPNGATVGFEMIAPTLVAEAEKLGLIKNQANRILGRISKQRAVKLAYLKDNMISRHVTMAFSAEMVGVDGKHMLDVDNLQESNGSVGVSPSATAYFATYIKKGDEAAVTYLRDSMKPDGSFPNVAPFDVFEIGWSLWNLSLIPGLAQHAKLKPHLDFLANAWVPKRGVGFAAGYTVKDSDDTSLVFDTLLRFGIEKDLGSVLSYEEKDHFRCFDLEANPSISANIHVLGALGQAGLDMKNSSVQKVVRFLHKARGTNPFWADKWHASPYYATSHAIIACAGIANDLVAESVDWILSAQNKDGSWGAYLKTAEETAYAVQALWIWNQKVTRVPKSAMTRAARWLSENMDKPYPPLWIGKCLYSPNLVIRSAVISALALAG
ncbi:MAG TPA: prenyltransferase/squalene oxidase repeat-containing protein [Anaerolineales bacterium]|nr:prenyltransferase/squalene oxidase repeat-containing protein [Anaerolineales bacterium]HNS59897.1 prenyltransferase/squalene oxidase repeat-containing protein [Anaerolineales bacterium]